MSDFAELFSTFYTRFVLRDVFGKIIPGSFLICGLCLSTQRCDPTSLSSLSLGWLQSLVLLGTTWLTGLALQSLGEFIRVLRNVPAGEERLTFYRRLVTFAGSAPDHDKALAERLLVIKEASGNAGLALLLATLLDILLRIPAAWGSSPMLPSLFPAPSLSILAVVAGLCLIRWHHEHIARHSDYLAAHKA